MGEAHNGMLWNDVEEKKCVRIRNSLKPSIFGILIIGSDCLPFRIQIPMMSHPYISPSIAPPISPSLSTHTHTHSHTLSLSPLTLSSVTYLFTLTLQWMPPIASQVRRPLAHKPNISVPHAPFHTTR